MEFSPKDSCTFRSAIEALSTFLPQTSLHFKEDGLSIRGMDVSHVGFVDYFLSKNDCKTYKIPAPLTVGIETSVFAKSLSSVGTNDSVNICLNKTKDSIIISYKNEKVAKTVTYNIRTLDIDEEPLELPELAYSATIVTKTVDIAGMLREVSGFGDTLLLRLDDDGFHIVCKGDIGEVSQILLGVEGREMELTEDSVFANYAAKYVNNIVKGGGSLAQMIKLEFDSTNPLRITFSFGEGSRFQAYLAPKLMEEV